mmetsp:Transcript_118957/g.308782  ORF Transcript_118957/g.308782 Transcript_118957/m.308782 type:complete len:217 (+) Transcript_118957:67-717(+)
MVVPMKKQVPMKREPMKRMRPMRARKVAVMKRQTAMKTRRAPMKRAEATPMKARRAPAPRKRDPRVKGLYTISKAKLERVQVFLGRKTSTRGRREKKDFIKNKYGRIVSKKVSANSKRNHANSAKPWVDSIKQARKELGLTGFVLLGGKTAAGKALLAKVRAIYALKKKPRGGAARPARPRQRTLVSPPVAADLKEEEEPAADPQITEAGLAEPVP